MIFLPSRIASEITSLTCFLKIIYFWLALSVSNEVTAKNMKQS